MTELTGKRLEIAEAIAAENGMTVEEADKLAYDMVQALVRRFPVLDEVGDDQ